MHVVSFLEPDPSALPIDLSRSTPALRAAVGHLLGQPPEIGVTLGLLVLHAGAIIAEGYGPGCGAEVPLISWSTAKSITHAMYGLLVDDGLITVDTLAPIAEWADDERATITVQHLLNMRSGLAFREDYVDDQVSDVIAMLFGDGRDDVAGFAAALPLEHAVGAFWNYSSGTTNILCRIARDILGGGRATEAYLRERLFEPIGMMSATATLDASGTFIGSSFVHATTRDFARFGELYRNDGCWGDHRVLPAGWTDHARTPTGTPDTEEYGYGAHWWRWQWPGAFAAHGYEGQRILIVPDRDLVVVRLGKTVDPGFPPLRAALEAIVEAVPAS